jgi:hypothetical protein
MADMGAVYETVARLRWLPVGKETLAAIALPLAIPFAFLALASMPLAELLQTLLSMLK